jgi:hypothetical protein
MACPYFQPVKQLDSNGWDPVPRLPLGAAWSGFCLAIPEAPLEPPESVQQDFCNCGYARGRCASFPGDTAADAIRFAQQDGTLLYILEKDHAPLAFGKFQESEHGAALVAQARAFLTPVVTKDS